MYSLMLTGAVYVPMTHLPDGASFEGYSEEYLGMVIECVAQDCNVSWEEACEPNTLASRRTNEFEFIS